MTLDVARLASLSLALLAAGVAATAAAGEQGTPARVLVGDFVDLGPGARGPGRQVAQPGATVRLINETGVVVDVKLGEGSATLEPKQVLLARVDAGTVAFGAVARGDVGPPLEGTLEVARARQYALALTWRSGAGEPAAEGAPQAAEARGAEPAPAAPAARKAPARTRKGWVNVGRRK